MGIWASFWWQDALPHQLVRIREETLESENLFSGKPVASLKQLGGTGHEWGGT